VAHEFKLVRQVEFFETDAAGIVHFSNFFRWMEAAEQAFFRSLGLTIHSEEQSRRFGWPRVHAECDYRAPLVFEDVVEIQLTVRQMRERSIHYDFTFRKMNEEPPRAVARGSLGVACVRRDEATGALKSTSIPAEFSSKIEAAPKEAPVSC
jgi:acyl-CoA thioester hydrolase